MVEKKLKNAVYSKDINRINEAFNEFYNRYFKLIYYVISQYIDDKNDIEDITQEVFLKFFNNILNINVDKNVKYYLTTMAKNMSLNYLKSNNRKVVYANDLILTIIDGQEQIEKHLYNDIIDDLSKCLSELEVKIIVLHIIEGMKFKNISKQLNKSINSVITIYSRALKKFKSKKGDVYYG